MSEKGVINNVVDNVDVKNVVQCLVDGSLAAKLCLVCLAPLDEQSENIFTEICKENKEYSIAMVLEKVCGITLSESEYCVCSDCFISASSAYKFYLTCQRSKQILDFYIQELNKNLDVLELPIDQIYGLGAICISLPIIENSTEIFDYNLEGLALEKALEDDEASSIKSDITNGIDTNTVEHVIKQELMDEGEENVFIVLDESGKTRFYRQEDDATLVEVETEEKKSYDIVFRNSIAGQGVLPNTQNIVKQRKKRSPMEFKQCSKCPVKYRFTAKLRDHMLLDHKIQLRICKICKFTTECESEYQQHLLMHTDLYICANCGVSFKKRTTMVAHLKRHEERDKLTDGAHVCEICGQFLPTDSELKEHHDKRHDKKFTCFYCGRSYKGEISFESHIKKHEQHMNVTSHECRQCSCKFPSSGSLARHMDSEHKHLRQYRCGQCEETFTTQPQLTSHLKTHRCNFNCETCGRNFVDGRALLWHQRLHTNERPFPCDTCGRAFVSANRRNAHALCAHTAPARRCPLCPALFHLRSMVNSHIKKVHLNSHKRRNRSAKFQEVFWRTEPVPIQELSISVQNDLLEMKTSADYQPS